MLIQQKAASSIMTAAAMGLNVWDATKTGAAGTTAALAASPSDCHPGRRLRPSHCMPEEGSQRGKGSIRWSRNYTRWGDDNRVPMPMRRGIPFRGDVFGGLYYTEAIRSKTGT